MKTWNKGTSRRKSHRLVYTLPLIFILVSLACSLPTGGKTTPTPTQESPQAIPAQPTATPNPMPAGLAESQPPAGGELPLNGPITLYFNQPMDRASVEAALQVEFQQSLNFSWPDDSTVVVYLSEPLEPETQVSVDIKADVRSAQGTGTLQPISLSYTTAGYLRLAQALPQPGSADVNPAAAVVTSFNRPIVPLGGDPASMPPAFTLEPPADGRGEWINTSTYVFYPEPALQGGEQYTVKINADLKSVDGSPLQDVQPWSFSTVLPSIVSISPSTETPWPLDVEIALTFNQPMDRSSVEAAFKLFAPGNIAVPGSSSWNDDSSIYTFKPGSLLVYGTSYIVYLGGEAKSAGGAALGQSASISVITLPALNIYSTDPVQGGQANTYSGPILYFSGPIESKNAISYIQLEPSVANLSTWWNEVDNSLSLYGTFSPDTAYTLRVLPGLTDPWGGGLGQEFVLNFSTGAYSPRIMLAGASEIIFLTPSDPALTAEVVNVPELTMEVGSVPQQDLFMLLGFEGYERRIAYQSADMTSWAQSFDLEPNRAQMTDLYLRPDRSPLAPGIYFMRYTGNLPEVQQGTSLVAVSYQQVTLKISPTEALVWVVDLRTQTPQANAPVTLYDAQGAVLGSGQTDGDGILRLPLALQAEDSYSTIYAFVGQLGAENFGLGLSTWQQGVSPWEFGLPYEFRSPGLMGYFYTDRPMYRTGQTLYFRIVVRQAFNGRYNLPDLSSLPVTISSGDQGEVASFDLPLTAYGTAHGEFALPEALTPGYYYISSPALPNSSGVNFQIASYRKPEINLQVSFDQEQALAGQPLQATVDARYFFDAPAGNLPVHWTLYAAPTFFDLPGYQVGPQNTNWLLAYGMGLPPGSPELVAEGDGQTAPDGTLHLEFTSEAAQMPHIYQLEVTAKDESGLPVSARSQTQVNPADFYIGVRPDSWVGRAGEASGFDIQVVDWEAKAGGVRQLSAEFKKVVWVPKAVTDGSAYDQSEYVPEYTPVASTDFSTNEEGQARLSFTPTEPGTYQLDVFSPLPGELGARTEFLLWTAGEGQAVWPNFPNSRLHLTADRETYQPGDTARVFIPNPFGAEVLALVTTERGTIMDHQMLRIAAGGSTIDLPLSGEQAPNVYIAVTLLGSSPRGLAEFRQGYLNLVVNPLEQTLQVQLVGEPQRAGPGDEVTLDVLVTDAQGSPVQGEFSLAVVDLAALALAEPNSPDIATAFYSQSPLGVSTGNALAAYGRRDYFEAGGLGGGGGEAALSVARENFPDTAYWNAELVTGPDGRATVSLRLPDTLTTWQVDTRGLDMETRVGQAQTQIVTSKDLLVRPVTPRFLVVNDHVQMAAIVQNNIESDLQVEVSLQATGFTLDEPASAVQQVTVAAGGRQRVEWWGRVDDVLTADLVFAVKGTDASGQVLEDAARPALGALPVQRYIAQQTFRTSGVLDEAGEILELVSIPRSFAPDNGQFNLELSPSLAASMMGALQVLEHSPYESTEGTVSRFLPNLEVFRAMQQFSLEIPGGQDQLNAALNNGLQQLQATQNPDGGWGWWQDSQSDAYITSYVLLGLSRAQQAGINVSDEIIRRAVEYLQSGGDTTLQQGEAGQPGSLDRQAFKAYVLALAGAGDLEASKALYEDRGLLSPWAQAVLLLALDKLAPDSAEQGTLIADLQAQVVRSATGVFWELPQSKEARLAAQQNMHTSLSNSAVVLYALAQRDPASPLTADAVRYLMSNRGADGAWHNTYTTSWSLMALAEVVKGTGELGGNFTFGAALNGAEMAQGQAGGADQLTPVTAQLPLQRLYADYPNALTIQRSDGQGRLYYATSLTASRPAQGVEPLSQGLHIERSIYPQGDACPDGACEPIQSIRVGQKAQVRLTLSLPNDIYYLVVEDYIPAGAEILDVRLKTSQQFSGEEVQYDEFGQPVEPVAGPLYDPANPFVNGWGMWLFHPEQIYDDHIAWAADYLPAGTYILTYTLVPLQAGQFQVLPARAWQFYFPEVQANSAGSLFEIKP